MLDMVQDLKDSTMTNDSPLPDRECSANWKMWQSCLGDKKLNSKSLRLTRRKTLLKRNEKPNRKVFWPNAENSPIFALENSTLPSASLGRKECDFNNDLWRYGLTHAGMSNA